MPDADRMSARSPAALPLGAALRALPMPLPPASQWSRLQPQLPAPTRPRRWPFALALAAGLAALAVLPGRLTPPASVPAEPLATLPSTADFSQQLAELQAESAQLEGWLSAIDERAEGSAESAAARGQIVDRVQWIDALLAAAERAETRQALWQERVLLLRRLTLIEGRSQWLAAAGDAESAAPLVTL